MTGYKMFSATHKAARSSLLLWLATSSVLCAAIELSHAKSALQEVCSADTILARSNRFSCSKVLSAQSCTLEAVVYVLYVFMCNMVDHNCGKAVMGGIVSMTESTGPTERL